MSVSAFPYGTMASAGSATLNLGESTTSNAFDRLSPYNSVVGIRLLTTGNLQKIFAGQWVNENVGVEWVSDFGGTSSSDYEAKLQTTNGTYPQDGGLTENVYYPISSTRTWSYQLFSEGSYSFLGVLTIREIANPTNIVTGNISMSIENGQP